MSRRYKATFQTQEEEMSKTKKLALVKLGSARAKTLGSDAPTRLELVIPGYFPA